MKRLSPIMFFVLLVIVSGCSSSEQNQLMNLDAVKSSIQNYYESGKYDADCSKIIDDGINYINKIKLSGKSAVVFDIDDTALSNYEQTKSIGFGYVYKLWHQFIHEGKAPAIKETKRFYDFLLSKNIHIVFLSGRNAEVLDITKKNLAEQGYARYDTLIVRTETERNTPASEFKTIKRGELTQNGYDIIACIGDQWSDLTGGNTGYKLKLPNFLYLID
jgi:acid phosphatase